MLEFSKLRTSPNIVLFIILLIMLFASLGAGISGDEDLNLRYGGRVLDYFLTAGEDKSCLGEVRGPDYAYSLYN